MQVSVLQSVDDPVQAMSPVGHLKHSEKEKDQKSKNKVKIVSNQPFYDFITDHTFVFS